MVTSWHALLLYILMEQHVTTIYSGIKYQYLLVAMFSETQYSLEQIKSAEFLVSSKLVKIKSPKLFKYYFDGRISNKH